MRRFLLPSRDLTPSRRWLVVLLGLTAALARLLSSLVSRPFRPSRRGCRGSAAQAGGEARASSPAASSRPARAVVLAAAAALLALPALAEGASAPGTTAAAAKKRCRTVVRKSGGKKKRVRVCKAVKPKPSALAPAGKIVGTATFDTPVASVAVAAGSVWATLEDGRTIVRVDPSTMTVTATLRNPLRAEWPPGIAAGPGGVWISNPGPDSDPANPAAGYVVRIDGVTNAFSEPVPVGRSPGHVVVFGGSVWTANHRSDEPLGASGQHTFTVSRVDAAGHAEVARIPVERRTSAPDAWGLYCCGPQAIAAGAGSIWVGDVTPRTVYRIDPATNAVVAAIKIPVEEACGGLAADDASVWLATGCNWSTIKRIDAATNAISASVRVPGVAQDVALGSGAVWATTADPSPEQPSSKPTLVRIDPATRRIVGSSKVPHAGDVEAGDGAVWVAAGRKLLKFRP